MGGVSEEVTLNLILKDEVKYRREGRLGFQPQESSHSKNSVRIGLTVLMFREGE